jgi:ribosomal-protein-alanine N-acetyltransferase
MDMTAQLPSWPTTPPTYGSVVLRAFTDEDTHLPIEFGDDPYTPLITDLPAHPTAQQALEWIRQQRGRLAEGIGLSFAIADAESDDAVGAIGLWLHSLSAGHATAGYAVSPRHRGRGIATSALKALTTFAWTLPAVSGSSYTSSRGTLAPSMLRKRRDTSERACSAGTTKSAALARHAALRHKSRLPRGNQIGPDQFR